MKDFLKQYGGWILSGILLAVIVFIIFSRKSDYSLQENQIKEAQLVRDSIRPVIDSLTRELEATKNVVTQADIERDSLYELVLEANKNYLNVINKQKAVIRVDNIGSDSLRRLYGEIARFYANSK